MAMLHTLSAITSEQANHTERTMHMICVHQLLDYMHTNPNVVIYFYALYMILNVHHVVSYISGGRV